MQGNRSHDTQAELAVRRLVHAAGLRYRVNVRPERDLRRTADLLFSRARVVVLIDGCYWHGCPQHYRRPSSNRRYWDAKVLRNASRDREVDAALMTAGWLVVRAWEHEDPVDVAARVESAVRQRTPPRTPSQDGLAE